MPLLFQKGSPSTVISDDELKSHVKKVWRSLGSRKKVMLIPPDYTRYHSRAGVMAQAAFEMYGDAVKDVMPALGTHKPMTESQRTKMFGKTIPKELFRVHDWRNDVVTIGHVSGDLVAKASRGRLTNPWPAQLNKLVWKGGHDLILSLGQVVPHEVLGMANHSKNLFVGVGGADAINFSHFIGAVYGMERMMGRADNPLRRIFNTAAEKYLKDLPVVYALTVVGRDEKTDRLVTRGLFVGTGTDCFYEAAKLSIQVNFTLVEPIRKCVVHLDKDEYHATWCGNKSIYRTRMAIEDGGELVVIAPGVGRFGEDDRIDELIRKYGYRTTPEILDLLEKNTDMMKNLSAVAHLMHGSTEGRFKVTYCAKGLTKEEVESVGYAYGDFEEYSEKYDVTTLKDGWNTMDDGEKVFYIENPAVGLWATKSRFESDAARVDAVVNKTTTDAAKRRAEVDGNDETQRRKAPRLGEEGNSESESTRKS